MTKNEEKLINVAIEYASEGQAGIGHLRDAAEDVLAERGRGKDFQAAVSAVVESGRALTRAENLVARIPTQAGRARVYQSAREQLEAESDG